MEEAEALAHEGVEERSEPRAKEVGDEGVHERLEEAALSDALVLADAKKVSCYMISRSQWKCTTKFEQDPCLRASLSMY